MGDQTKRAGRTGSEAGEGVGKGGWRPEPADTSEVVLPAGIETLAERLARNTHENWASQRLSDGWSWGPERDDRRREHPCLVPYEELPESEREYDRRTALETLRLILALGWEIVTPPEAGRPGRAAERRP